MSLVLVSVFALFYVTAALDLCPHQKHLEGVIDKCHGKLSKLGEISKQLADIASTYEKQCAEELAPGASSAEIQRMRCVDEHFEKQFYRCWAGVLDDDRLLSDAGFTNEDVHIFKESIKCKFGVLGIEV
ncbi:uncharacterized protein LOC8023955 [Ixodes scapularis]|uniref:uncharacterized protein LOC8023955 n=1 Tax=Ixodes scapularis TaxID=6945 RepID=UPI001A9EF745|nr:uncharacterized protein LOC8023955 [Ixodes scapularis]